MVPVAAHVFIPSGNESNGTDTSATNQLKHTLVHDITGIRFGYADVMQYQGSPGSDTVTVKAAVWLPVATPNALYFGGIRARVLDPTQVALTDERAISGTDGDILYSKTYVSVASGDKWPNNIYASGGSGVPEGFDIGSDKTLTGTVIQQDGHVFGPLLILGRVSGRVPVVCLMGDSIGRGQGDDQGYTHRGWFNRAFADTTSMLNLSQDGAAVGGVVTETTAGAAPDHLRWSLVPGCTHYISAFGVNDAIGRGDNAATIIANLEVAYARALAAGVEKVYQTTITPIESATSGQKAIRNTVNDEIRALSLTGLDGVIQMAAATETTVNSNVWNSTSGTSWSGDGVHPGSNGHTAMAQVLLDAQTAGMFD
jgi:lysophospholipase L1-like esterase